MTSSDTTWRMSDQLTALIEGHTDMFDFCEYTVSRFGTGFRVDNGESHTAHFFYGTKTLLGFLLRVRRGYSAP